MEALITELTTLSVSTSILITVSERRAQSSISYPIHVCHVCIGAHSQTNLRLYIPWALTADYWPLRIRDQLHNTPSCNVCGDICVRKAKADIEPDTQVDSNTTTHNKGHRPYGASWLQEAGIVKRYWHNGEAFTIS